MASIRAFNVRIDGEFSTKPTAPRSLYSVKYTTDLLKLGSSINGSASNKRPASGLSSPIIRVFIVSTQKLPKTIHYHKLFSQERLSLQQTITRTQHEHAKERSEERRVGKEGGSKCRSRGAPNH